VEVLYPESAQWLDLKKIKPILVCQFDSPPDSTLPPPPLPSDLPPPKGQYLSILVKVKPRILAGKRSKKGVSWIRCLVDTGATVNIINAALVPPQKRIQAPHPKNFKAVNGEFFPGGKHGMFLELAFKAQKLDGSPCTVVTPPSFFYDGDIACQCILSYDFLVENRIAVLPFKDTLVAWPSQKELRKLFPTPLFEETKTFAFSDESSTCPELASKNRNDEEDQSLHGPSVLSVHQSLDLPREELASAVEQSDPVVNEVPGKPTLLQLATQTIVKPGALAVQVDDIKPPTVLTTAPPPHLPQSPRPAGHYPPYPPPPHSPWHCP
jgi:hypothetical protein